MNKQGFYHRLDKCPTLIQCSVWDIVTEAEHKKIMKLITDIQDRNPGCDVKITFEVKERVEHGNS